MNRKLFLIAIIILAFVASFLLASYLSGNNISLHTQLRNTLQWVELLFLDEPEAVISKTPIDKVKFKDEASNHHVEVGRRPVCKDISLGELAYKKTGKVYTWTDEHGIPHFSDTPPQKGEFESLNYAGEKIFDYFSLDLNTESLPYDFNQKLTVKLNKLFELYGKLLDRSSLKKVDINLQVYQSKMAFEQVKKQHNVSSGDNINGFYSHGNNQAYLLFRNNERTMRTAAHEATHAINRAIIGYTPRWLNEGLSEYSENIEVKGISTRVYPNGDWTSGGVLTEALLPLSFLISASNKDWNSTLRHRLYATSWAFIHFMMEDYQRKQALAKIKK
ncbi:MAG: DUF4124 domain-containing protein [Colwellia sp.]|nr:DUF4124 domain-containing protein [Colwellia sp.]